MVIPVVIYALISYLSVRIMQKAATHHIFEDVTLRLHMPSDEHCAGLLGRVRKLYGDVKMSGTAKEQELPE